MKLCSKCKINETATSIHNGSYCRPCRNLYQAAYAKKTRYLSTKKTRNKIRDLIITLKLKPCEDCKQSYPWYVMDFDHVKGTKKFNLSIAAAKIKSKKRVLEEISKCDLVCANCHRERTFNRIIPI